ncbi:hypothetical protein PP568_07095 [Mycobacteroides abscessus]|uniref:Uncharacterized protein n=1 Tax=Mycobacteroides abscessus subsp. abscessus TaxID=1185650 RepID=A0AB38D330_9MYCO|nr:hypothetical protein [Mycobacteroides abscessus]MBE5419621.1 hypothetical protein [Mycobacteroides abscessus]MBE5455679.1 hypothetical protein [Mycobacteroides abscessus]MBN7462941.1 hypothetical protein [Mycobacteroides abscessus subsp. abscessus]MBN7555303.1 hypothetical protein [Mycobacteroides abscessus subsp. abscessus]MDM2404698.1 hypothetical protein [Mycobacteroides abscessus]
MSTTPTAAPSTTALVAVVQDLALQAGAPPAVVSSYGYMTLSTASYLDDRDTCVEDTDPDPVLEAADRELRFAPRAEMGDWIAQNWQWLSSAALALDALSGIAPDPFPAPVPGALAYRNAGGYIAFYAGESCAAVAWAGAVAEARWIRLMTGREASWEELAATNAPAKAAYRHLPAEELVRVRDWILASWEQVDDMASAAA